jgi:hypothetical protein
VSGHWITRQHTGSGLVVAVLTCSEPVGAPCRTALDLDFDPLGSTTVDIDGCRAVAAMGLNADHWFLGFLNEDRAPVAALDGPVAVEERLPGHWWWRYATEGAQAVTAPQEAAA